jgi:ferredoxin-NADP reductase
MATPISTVTCLKKSLIARDTYDLLFTKPAGFSHKAGQTVLWRVPLLADPSDIQPRAYSIASTSDEEHLRFAVRLKPGGRASEWIVHALKEGGTLDLQGPFGLFTLKHDEPTRPLLFIATGTGLAPFRSHIRELQQQKHTGRIDLVFGVRDEADLFWTEEMTALGQQFEQFFLHLALSQPSPAWTGHRGRVQTLVPLIAKDIAAREVYICGNPDMTKELKALCLGEWGAAKERLHAEGFI